MTTNQSVFNADTVPVQIDRAGRILGAGEHGEADLDCPAVAKAIEAGRLLIVSVPVLEPENDVAPPEDAAPIGGAPSETAAPVIPSPKPPKKSAPSNQEK